MTVSIRKADRGDLGWLLGECTKFDAFFGARFTLVPDAEEANAFLTNIIDNHLFFVSEVDGKMSGFICGIVTPSIFKKDVTMLTEMMWWVNEDYRRGRSGLALFNEFVSWGKDNVDMINFALEHNSPIKDGTLTKRGFKLKERAFTMECG